ncbi:hypothetical protein BO71DRAFT_319422, partial [Aspergillus ellipticus CBS 707.79]
IEPFSLASFGNWGQEARELQDRLGWTRLYEPGKFFSHQNVDHWHYHNYAQGGDAPKNEIMSRCMRGFAVGDVAVVRSSNTNVNDYSDEFTKAELLRTTNYYVGKEGSDENEQRERSRSAGLFGMPPECLPAHKTFTMP